MTAIDVIGSLGLYEGAVTTNEPLSKHTTFRIGGPAEVFVRPQTNKELLSICKACKTNGIMLTIIGGGANVLVPDEGIPGVVLATTGLTRIEVCKDEKEIAAGAGVNLAALAKAAMNAGLSGLEFLSGIPGTVGGAVYMNAGAFGHDMGEVIKVALILMDGEILWMTNEDMIFGYRKSFIETHGGILMEAVFKLKPGNPGIIQKEMQELNRRRKETQPLEHPSAGSAFKRPEGFYAGKLIEEAGLKGFTIGGAQVSEKHAGFIVNRGGATAEDVISLIKEIRRRVHEASGVWLQPEIQLLGSLSID